MYYNNDSSAILSVYPKTEVYEIAKSGGMIDDDFWLSDKPVPAFTLENNLEKLFYFKDILLNHICSDRLFMMAGMKRQFTMLPYIVRNKHAIFAAMHQLLKSALPDRIYELLREQYRKSNIVRRIRSAL